MFKRKVFMILRHLRFLGIILTVVCLSCIPEVVALVEDMGITCLIINKRKEEVLVREFGNNGPILCFLKTGEEYRWTGPEYIDPPADSMYEFTFKFYIKGETNDFTKYLSEYILRVKVYDNIVYSDTCYVQ